MAGGKFKNSYTSNVVVVRFFNGQAESIDKYCLVPGAGGGGGGGGGGEAAPKAAAAVVEEEVEEAPPAVDSKSIGCKISVFF